MKQLNILTFSTLYPNAGQPNHGLFVEHRTRRLAAVPGNSINVVAPIPWFPSANNIFGRYSVYARTPGSEARHGITIQHPRYITIPKAGMTMAPMLLALGAYSALRRLQQAGFHFDLVDAHYFYPDGVAAAWLARKLHKPYIITARGTDINRIARHIVPRAMIRWAAIGAAHIVTVSEALKESLYSLDIEPKHVSVLRNGVDFRLFQPTEKHEARRRVDVSSPMLLSVGNLVELKGHHLVIESMQFLPGIQLSIIGEGPMRPMLIERINRLGLNDRVRLIGAVPQSELPIWYSAADALVLASSREGMANVLLESIACGTPVVATGIGGTPEVITNDTAGRLVERNPESIATGVRCLLNRLPESDTVRAYAQNFSWEPVISRLTEIMGEIVSEKTPSQANL